MKSRVATVGFALVATALWVSVAPLVSQSHETPLSPSLKRFESHMARWNVSSDRQVILDLTDGTSLRGHMCGTPPATPEFLAETRAVLSIVSEETAGFETQAATQALIPLFFHVIQTPSRNGRLADEQIVNQVEVLNQKYKSAGLQFFIQGVEDVVNKSWFKKCLPVNKKGKRNGKYFKMTRKLAVDPTSTINIYTCRPFADILGLGILAGWLPEGHKANAVVLHHLTLPGGPSPRYSLGITGVHEVGHYLGLWHTFHPGLDGMPLGCTGDGDEVGDTPFEAEPAFECERRDTCPQPGRDPIRNFMDYTDDKCRRKFSKGQRRRMLNMTLAYRPGLLGVN